MSFTDKVKDLLGQHGDKVDEAIEKAGDMVDRKTDGKYARQVDMAQEQAHKYAERAGEEREHGGRAGEEREHGGR